MIRYKFRPYTKADFEFVYQIKKDAYKRYVEKFWGTWDEEKQRSFFVNFIQKVQNFLSIIEYKNNPIGIYHGNILNQNTYEIGNIIVVPEYRGRGIGENILLKIIKKYSKSKIHLQVFKGNPAINLYKRIGFNIINETQTHYIMEYK